MTAVELLVVGLIAWTTFVGWQLRTMAAELRDARVRIDEQAQLVADIAANAEKGGHFMTEHRDRIERLERFAVLVGGPLVDDEN